MLMYWYVTSPAIALLCLSLSCEYHEKDHAAVHIYIDITAKNDHAAVHIYIDITAKNDHAAVHIYIDITAKNDHAAVHGYSCF
jgi:hypothetical protein